MANKDGALIQSMFQVNIPIVDADLEVVVIAVVDTVVFSSMISTHQTEWNI